MYIRSLKECEEFIAGDKTILRQLLHPDNHQVKLNCSIAHATLRQGDSSLNHALRTAEIYYILSGTGEMHIDNEEEIVREGQIVYIPPRAKQFIRNIGDTDLKFLCIVDPAWREEDEVVF